MKPTAYGAALVRAALSMLLVALATGAAGQQTLTADEAAAAADLLNTSPRGIVDVPPLRAGAGAASGSGASNTARRTSEPGPVPGPLPPDPATSAQPIVFGTQIFSGRFAAEQYTGFDPEYQVGIGDRINIRLWGAFNFEGAQTVDAQGNVFLPNVGPVPVAGVRNADLNRQVEAQVTRTFRANVGVYATLDRAQPVKVYVTGFVRAPGLYGGSSADSVLHYLDRAGGIDPDRGSFLEVNVLRGGKRRATLNLYHFLLGGHLELLQLQDGDTITVAPRKHTVTVRGEVSNPYVFEFAKNTLPAAELLAISGVKSSATHLSIVRRTGPDLRSEYHALAEAARVTIEDGDEVTVTSDKYPGTILVRVEGAQLGSRTLVLPYGARLQDALSHMHPAPQANVAALQLFRRSVAVRQKDLLEQSLRSLETYALTARSATSEEAALRTREADLILQFVARARNVQPAGQVVLSDAERANLTLLEDGDVLRIPTQSNLVLVSGEVMLPNAVIYRPSDRATDYVKQVGGYTQNADTSRLLVMHQGGAVSLEEDPIQPGDEIMALPKVSTKNIEVTRGITQIIYQIAVAAKVAFGL
jgi:protein involved in polysaccharide export with SLBB domain